ncbi:hypothetical protein IAR50_000366 [Cryptococcus sp. DSM 104548]
MFFIRLATLALVGVSLTVTALAMPARTMDGLFDAERYHEDSKRHHPSAGTNSHPSASASGVKCCKPTQTAVATYAILGAAIDLS